MGVRAHVDALPRAEGRGPDMVEEYERADGAPPSIGQHPAHGKPAEVARPRSDNQVD
jgi:hypothetical protein